MTARTPRRDYVAFVRLSAAEQALVEHLTDALGVSIAGLFRLTLLEYARAHRRAIAVGGAGEGEKLTPGGERSP